MWCLVGGELGRVREEEVNVSVFVCFGAGANEKAPDRGFETLSLSLSLSLLPKLKSRFSGYEDLVFVFRSAT
jgi:hypothetical protein